MNNNERLLVNFAVIVRFSLNRLCTSDEGFIIPFVNVSRLIAGFVLFLSFTPAAYAAEHVPVLVYHRIEVLPAYKSFLLKQKVVSPSQLEHQIAWLVWHGFHLITMEQFIAHLRHAAPLPSNPVILTFDDTWKEHYNVVFPLLKKYNVTATFFITTSYIGSTAHMQWKQIEEMSDAGMDMEAHAVTHRQLINVSELEVYDEMLGSKEILEEHLHKKVNVFAYPFGAYNKYVIQVARLLGYEGAVTVQGFHAAQEISKQDFVYTISRRMVKSEDGGSPTAAGLIKLLF